MTKNPPKPQRTLPHSTSSEASVLGGVILRNDVLGLIPELEAEHFYDHRHRIVFQAIRNLEFRKQPIDVVTLEAEIEKQGKFEAIGGPAFLGQLALLVPTADNVLAYADIVRDKARIRGLMMLAAEITERGYLDDMEADEYFDRAFAELSKIDRAKPDEAKTMGEYVRKRVAELEELVRAREAGETVFTGIPTGIRALDAKTGGYPLGDLVVLAARPAMGKTAMAMSAIDAATASNLGAHVFSQEGGWRMQADRAISRASGIPVSRIRAGDLHAEDARAIANAVVKYHQRPRWLLDARAGLSATDIIRCVRRHKSELGTKLVVVDYVQTLRRPRGFETDENAALDATITAFAQAALADDICYLVLSQLNREVEKRNDKRMQMSDLRGSGALEERPRMIVSPYRGSVYYSKPRPEVDFDCKCEAAERQRQCICAPDADDFARTAQVLIVKNSNGATGRVFANWKPETAEMW